MILSDIKGKVKVGNWWLSHLDLNRFDNTYFIIQFNQFNNKDIPTILPYQVKRQYLQI